MKKINLTIPKPCHENWDKMTQEQQGRFCGSCQKTVIDFTDMSDRQLAEFFKKPVGSVCGRFEQDQLDRKIVIPRKRIPWVKYFFQFALPAFLVSLKASAQKTSAIKGDVEVCSREIMGKVAMPRTEVFVQREISGMVHNEKGEPIPFATIRVKGENKTATSDAQGMFKLKVTAESNHIIVSAIGYEVVEIAVTKFNQIKVVLPAVTRAFMGEVVVPIRKECNKRVLMAEVTQGVQGRVVNENGDPIPYATISFKKLSKVFSCDSSGRFKIRNSFSETTLVATAVGYQEAEANIDQSESLIISLKTKVAALDPISIGLNGTVGRVMIAGGVTAVRTNKYIPSPSIIKKVIESAFSKFSVYPNPARRGSSVKLDTKRITPGSYLVSIININGSIVENKEILISNKNEVHDLNLPEIAAGTYFVRLTNKATGQSYNERIIVQ